MDRDELSRQYRSAVVACAGTAISPLLLAFIAWQIATAPERASDVAAADSLVLTVLGVLAMSPVVITPIVRKLSRNSAIANRVAKTPEASMAFWALAECALWEGSRTGVT